MGLPIIVPPTILHAHMSSTTPQSYTVYQWEAPNTRLVKAEQPWQNPEQGEVVVKILASGVCATDDLIRVGSFPARFPVVPGHEIVGDIVAVHPSVIDFRVGDRVGAPFQRGFCGDCHHCQSGQLMGCDKLMNFLTGASYDGGYAQFLRVPTTGVCRISKEIDPAEAAPLMCAGVTVFNGLEQLKIKPNSTVAIQGIGGLGHLALQYAKAMGARTVAISTSDKKKELSLQLGADIYIDESSQNAVEELQKLGGADVIVSTAPNAAGMLKLIDGLAFEGKLLVVSAPHDQVPFNPGVLLGKRLSIHGTFVGTAEDCARTVEYTVKHNIKVLVEKFPFSKAEEVFRHRENARFRSVIVPE